MKLLRNYRIFKISAGSRLSLLLHGRKYKQFFLQHRYAFQDKYGLEIGGPSPLFTKDILPVYHWARLIDGCNFSNNTLWEGTIKNSEYGYTPGKTGHQYILDGTNLNGIESNRYDFLLSCHNLEHIANPLRAIQEWVRVLKPGGQLLLILPDKRFTFDRKRAYTPFEHLVQDFNMNTGEDDLTHLPEILQLHDLRLDPGAGRDFEVFKKRGEQNPENRGLHHHVFSGELLKKSLAYFQVNTLAQYFLPPFHQIIIGQK